MGFGGGGGGGEITQYNPQVNDPYPQLTGNLVNASIDSLTAFRPYGYYGAGYQMANLSPMGQIYTPGPNQSLFGNPYTTQGHQPYFGQSPQYPSNIGFGGGAGGGTGVGGGGGSNTTSGDKLSGYVPPAMSALPAGRAYTQGSDLLGLLNSALQTQNVPPPGGVALPPPPASTGGGGVPYWATPREPELNPTQIQPPPVQQASGGGAVVGSNTPTAPPPPSFNTSSINGDPYGIAAGNAPVGANGQPQNLQQLQQLEQMLGYNSNNATSGGTK